MDRVYHIIPKLDYICIPSTSARMHVYFEVKEIQKSGHMISAASQHRIIL
jgi:hypothetical protein